MKSIPLSAQPRELKKRTGVKKVRAGGKVPAVMYGRHGAPRNLQVDLRHLELALHGAASENVLVDLTVDGEGGGKHLALVQEVQHDLISRKIIHIDLHEVKPDEMVTLQVPVETTGEAAGVKVGGGVLEHVLFKLRVRALPKDLPEVIEVDVTNLQLGQTLHIGELTLPAGVEALGHKEVPVVSIAEPLKAVEAEAAPADGAAAAAAPAAAKQPEMLKEKKDAAKPAAAPAAAKKK